MKSLLFFGFIVSFNTLFAQKYIGEWLVERIEIHQKFKDSSDVMHLAINKLMEKEISRSLFIFKRDSVFYLRVDQEPSAFSVEWKGNNTYIARNPSGELSEHYLEELFEGRLVLRNSKSPNVTYLMKRGLEPLKIEVYE